MSASETSISSKPQCRITATTTIAPPTITSTRPGSSPGLCRRCAIGSVASVRNTSSAAARVSRKWWMRVARRRVDAELDRGQRPHRSRRPDRASWRVRTRREPRGRRRRGGRARPTPPGSAPRASADRECRNCSVRRTQPMSIEISPSGSSVPTMNSVEPPPTSTTRYGSGSVEAGGRAEELEPRLLVAREQLGPHAEQLLGRVEELVAVRRVARRARRRRAHALDAEVVDRRAGTRAAPRACARSRRDAASRSRSTPWPRRVIRVRRSIGHELGVAARAVDVGDEQPRRVGADVDGGDARHCRCSSHPATRRDRRRRRGCTRSARAGTSRRGASRRRRRADAARRGRRRARRRVRRA